MQEDNLVYILVFLITQTIALYQKLSAIEQKIDVIQKHNDKQDERINKLYKVMADKVNGAAKELTP